MALPFTKQDAELCLQETLPMNNMSCAICIVEDEFHDRFSVVRRCVIGTMRCKEHTMQCANCKQEVDTDAQLLCFACSDSGQAAVFHERLTTSKIEKCFFDKNKPEGVWGCGCSKCMETTAAFYYARAAEEGCASSPMASPRTPKGGFSS